LQRALAHIERAAVVERDRGARAHLQHQIVVRHGVVVVALLLIEKAAAVDVVRFVRVGGMGRIER
jgi:hypothetical protein